MRRCLLICSVLFLSFLSATLVAASLDDDFRLGNNAYENKLYDDAIASYSRVLAGGLESSNLYFNLGNAYFKKGDLGHAIVNYLKASRLSPGDEDIKSNLAFARKFTSVQMEGVQLNPVRGLLTSIVDRFRLSTLAWLSSLLFLSFISLLIIRFGIGIIDDRIRPLAIVALSLFVLASALTTFKYRSEFQTRHAVIVAQECPVRTGPTDQSDLELQGAPGLVVEIVSESNDYYNVVFENMRRGWIKKSLVAEV
ncbi:MAG: tetratricopeptide repeat protein [Candidatus Zixiibacteriota bacterium]